MTIDIEILATWIGTLGAVVTPIFIFMRKISAFMLKIDHLYSWIDKQQIDIEDGKRERGLITKIVRCMTDIIVKGLPNAETSELIKLNKNLEAFIEEKAHTGKSSL